MGTGVRPLTRWNGICKNKSQKNISSRLWFRRFFCVLINPPYWYAPICPPPRERQRSVINDYSLEWIVHPVRSSSFHLLSVWHNSTSARLFLNVLSKTHKRSTVFPSQRK